MQVLLPTFISNCSHSGILGDSHDNIFVVQTMHHCVAFDIARASRGRDPRFDFVLFDSEPCDVVLPDLDIFPFPWYAAAMFGCPHGCNRTLHIVVHPAHRALGDEGYGTGVAASEQSIKSLAPSTYSGTHIRSALAHRGIPVKC